MLLSALRRLVFDIGIRVQPYWDAVKASINAAVALPSESYGIAFNAALVEWEHKVAATPADDAAREEELHMRQRIERSGKMAYAVMSFGGFLGMGQSYHPLPWEVLTYDTNQGGYVVDLDKDRLTNAPSYQADEDPFASDPLFGQRIDDYWKSGRMTL